PLKGNRIRTIGPESGKVVDAKFQRSDRVGRTRTLGGGAESSLENRDIELSVSPKDIRTSPYDLCANRSDRRQSREGDRWFESGSLQRRVRCELRAPHAVQARSVRRGPSMHADGSILKSEQHHRRRTARYR